MFTRIRLKNFRLFKDTGDIQLAPLTFFIGPNSGGKSTIIQALLFLKQSAETNRPHIFNGPYCELGSFQSLVHKKDISEGINIEVDYSVPLPYSLDHKKYKLGLKLRLKYDDTSSVVFIDSLDILTEDPARNAAEVDDQNKDCSLKKVISAKRNDSGSYNLQSEIFNQLNDVTLERIHNFNRVATEILKRGHEGTVKVLKEAELDHYLSIDSYELFLQRKLETVKYLSQERQPPREIYGSDQSMPNEVGKKGESTWTCMYVYPELLKKMSSHIFELGLAKDIFLEEVDENKFKVNLSNNAGFINNLKFMGTGVPRVLPIIVQGILAQLKLDRPENAREGSVLIFEQPEIELNPSAQVELGGFLAGLAGPGLQVIVETHSEHLLNRTRTLITKGEIPHEDVAVYYCTLNEDGEGEVERLRIDEDGKFENFPRDFFDEGMREVGEQMRILSAKKRGAR